MGITRTTASLLLEIRHLTDRDVDPALVDNTHSLPWLNEEIRKLWILAAAMNRDEYTRVSNAFTIPSGNTFTIAAGGIDGVATADFLDMRGVDYTVDGVHFVPLKPWRFQDRGNVCHLSYRRRARTLELLPAELARNWPIRYWYVSAAPTLTNGGESIELPFGGDDYVTQGVAARVRVRFEEEPTMHYAAQKAAFDSVQRWFSTLGQGPPEPIMAANPGDDGT